MVVPNAYYINILIGLPSLDGIKRAVEMGLGVALLPKRCAQAEIARGDLVAVKIPPLRLTRQVRLVYRRDGEMSHAAAAFSVPESCLLFAYGRARELARLASCFMEAGAFCSQTGRPPARWPSRNQAHTTGAISIGRMADEIPPLMRPSIHNDRLVIPHNAHAAWRGSPETTVIAGTIRRVMITPPLIAKISRYGSGRRKMATTRKKYWV